METPDGRLSHFSTFSGVGGLDLGLERAGWHTVAFSEIDPYACAVLAERWPGVPNLGDIMGLRPDDEPRPSAQRQHGAAAEAGNGAGDRMVASGAATARLWSGGFPCQDLSVAGKRAGMGLGHDGADTAATRSGLAFAFLDLVERNRPECILLENVPGLLSSHRGKDFGALLGRLLELRYGVAWRVVDAQHAGVPQRRRRVFILALDLDRHPDPDSAGKVLAVGAGCGRDHPQERAARAGAAGGAAGGAGGSGVVGTLDVHDARKWGSHQWVNQGKMVVGGAVLAREGKGIGHNFPDDHLIVGAPPDPDRVRAAARVGQLHPGGDGAVRADGPARGLDDRPRVAFVKGKRAQTTEDDESWRADEVTPTLNAFDVGDTRATTLVAGGSGEDDPLLPPGLDSHRYMVVGNGVVAPVAEWIGRRLAAYLRGETA